MIAAWVLLAAAGDWIQVIVWVVVISVGIINQLFSAANKKKPPPMRRPNAGGGNAGGGAANPAGGQKTLLDEVERFLQEARQQTAQSHNRPAQPQVPPTRQPQQQVGRSLPSQQKPPQQKKKKNQQGNPQRREQKPRPSLAEMGRDRLEVDDLEEVRLGGDIGRSTSRFDERAGKLSHLKQTVDTDIGSHVRNVFDHQVGSLGAGSAPPTADDAPPGQNVAAELTAMLKDPLTVRNAILMREILEPPTHRW